MNDNHDFNAVLMDIVQRLTRIETLVAESQKTKETKISFQSSLIAGVIAVIVSFILPQLQHKTVKLIGFNPVPISNEKL
jgi:hypothetical protein